MTFDADGRVTTLGAPSNEPKAKAGAPVYDFHGPLLPELGQLHHLEYLDLGYQARFASDAKERSVGRGPESLTGAIPPQLWRLPRLRHLDLQGQLLAWTLPSDIGRLASLEYLDLSHNWLSGPLPPELGRLASLRHLLLSGNEFTGAIPPELGRLTDLTVFRLNDNQLSGPLPPELGQFGQLRVLDLHGDTSVEGNQLSDPLPPEWGQLEALEYLDLSFNQLSGPLPPEWGQLANLVVLRLEHNQLTGPLPPATPVPLPTPTPTCVPTPVAPSRPPSLTRLGDYDNLAEHANGRYELQLSGTRVAATFSTTRSPVPHAAREVPHPLFTVPEPFRPPYAILRTAVGTPVRADGTPDHPEPRRFLLRVDPDGGVHYADDAHVEG